MKLVDDEGKEIPIADLKALSIREEDVIVLTLPSFVDADQAQTARNFFSTMFAGRKVITVIEGVKLSTVHQGEGPNGA